MSDDIDEIEETGDGEVGGFTVDREIVVSRRVLIQGNSILLPRIDCSQGDAVRCFRVTARGFLEMRYVRMLPGGGELFQRWSQGFVEATDDDTPSNQIQIVRGGCVLFEPGNMGGTFVGVMFIGDEGRWVGRRMPWLHMH